MTDSLIAFDLLVFLLFFENPRKSPKMGGAEAPMVWQKMAMIPLQVKFDFPS